MMLLISAKYDKLPDTNRLRAAAERRFIRTTVLSNNWDRSKLDKSLVFYGEHAFCEFLAQETNYNLLQNSLDWVAELDHEFIKRNIKCISLEEVIDLENSNQSILGKQFLEPADDPSFIPACYEVRFPRVPPDTEILVHTPHKWSVKYRCVIVHSTIVTHCCYQIGSIRNTPNIWLTDWTEDKIHPIEFAKQVIAKFHGAPAYILDVGYIENTGWAVCGTHPVWSSEVFGCDPNKYLDALIASCKPIV